MPAAGGRAVRAVVPEPCVRASRGARRAVRAAAAGACPRAGGRRPSCARCPRCIRTVVCIQTAERASERANGNAQPACARRRRSASKGASPPCDRPPPAPPPPPSRRARRAVVRGTSLVGRAVRAFSRPVVGRWVGLRSIDVRLQLPSFLPSFLPSPVIVPSRGGTTTTAAGAASAGCLAASTDPPSVRHEPRAVQRVFPSGPHRRGRTVDGRRLPRA